jgi:hypothetical protein
MAEVLDVPEEVAVLEAKDAAGTPAPAAPPSRPAIALWK